MTIPDRLMWALVFFVLLAGCGTDEEPIPPCFENVAAAPDGAWVRAVTRDEEENVLRVTLADRRVILVPGDPCRIVSTLPGITEIVAYLGAFDRLVAVSDNCDFPPAVVNLPRLAVLPLDKETLVELAPDLILVDAVLAPGALEDLEREGCPVLALESRSLAHFETTVALLAEVFNTDEAREQARRFRRRLVDALASIVQPPGPPPQDPPLDPTLDSPLAPPQDLPPKAPLKVLLLAQADPLYVLGPGSLLDDMVRAAGAVNVACDLGRPSGPFAEELVLERRPDWIIALDGPLPPLVEKRWASLPAVSEGRVAPGRTDALLRAGPRTPEALVRLADVLRERRPPADLEKGW